jgi:ADP-ribose pyrophosphatase
MRKVVPKKSNMVPSEAKCVFMGKIYHVYQWQQKMFDDSFETFEMLKRPDTVKVIAVKGDKIIILEQEQPDSEGEFYDVPGGRHDKQEEDELEAAKRETLEETGMTFRDWKLVRVEQPLAKIEQFIYTFIATGFEKQVEQKLDSGEKIKVIEMTLQEAKDLVGHPRARFLPKEILDKASGIEDLLKFPEFHE